MKRKLSKGLIGAYIMAGIGLAFILASVLNYIFGWKMSKPPAAIGIVFLAVGMAAIRKYRSQS